MRDWLARRPRGWHGLRGLRKDTIAIEQFDLNGQSGLRRFKVLNETIHIDAGSGRQRILGSHEYVFDKRRGHDAQRNLAIDAAESEIVNFVSEGRNIGALARVHFDGEHVFSVKIEVRSQIER